MTIGGWYVWDKLLTNDEWVGPKHAYQVIAFNDRFVVYKSPGDFPAHWSTLEEFERSYTLIALEDEGRKPSL